MSFSNVVNAQTTSTIEGTVTDKQGLAVSGTEVRVEGLTAAVSRSVTTDGSGAYQIPGLPAGVYKLTVTHEGFTTRIFEGLELTLNRTMNFDVKLEVGRVQERVEVSAEIPLLDTTSSSTGATIGLQVEVGTCLSTDATISIFSSLCPVWLSTARLISIAITRHPSWASARTTPAF
jgi:hypothetical protein